MERNEFYRMFFTNLDVFIPSIIFASGLLYLSCRRFSLNGLIDPFHFYWTFTFGTGYGIVIGLFIKGIVTPFYFLLVLGFGCVFILSLRFYSRIPSGTFSRVWLTIGRPVKRQSPLWLLIFLVFLFVFMYLLIFVGPGFLAEQNRFEQNRGSGVFVRTFVLTRLFFAAYIGILISRLKHSERRAALKLSSAYALWLIFAVVTSLIDGAKYAFLETIFASFIGARLFNGLSNKKKPLNYKIIILVICSALVFATYVYNININNNDGLSKKAEYVPGPYVVQAIALRVLANGDKYFLGLSDTVMDSVEVKPSYVRIVGALISSTLMSNIVGYDINRYSIGKQIFYYWHPDWAIAGGPTSHFDLYAFKQFGLLGGIVFISFISFFLSRIFRLKNICANNDYLSCIVTILWMRSLAILLEPPLGIGYVFDVFCFFTFFAVLRFATLRKNS